MLNSKQKFSIDIEVTNKCNAKCYFCPRDATPHEGIMDVETFDKALQRAVEYRDLINKTIGGTVTISLCGLGEPLLNKNIVSFVKKVKAKRFVCSISSNGAPMTEKRAKELIDAGVNTVYFNVSDINEEYEKVYKIPFARTRDNITRFVELTKDKNCGAVIVLVDHHEDQEHLDAMKKFWGARGVDNFHSYGVINRGGALFVDDMQFESYAEIAMARKRFAQKNITPICSVPFSYLFIGYDGNYYLCCSDWRKQGNAGNIFDQSFVEVTQKKLEMVTSRNPVCKTCNHDPLNRMTQELRALSNDEITPQRADDVEKFLSAVIGQTNEVLSEIMAHSKD